MRRRSGRPMRYVAVKTEEQQARAMLFRTRDLLVRQRTQLINALRGHLAEHGVVAPQGRANVKGLAEAIESETTSLPRDARRDGSDLLGLSRRRGRRGLDLPGAERDFLAAWPADEPRHRSRLALF